MSGPGGRPPDLAEADGSRALFRAPLCTTATVVFLPVLMAGFVARGELVQGLSMGAVT